MLRNWLDRLPYIGRLRRDIKMLMGHVDAMQRQIGVLNEERARLQAQVDAQGMFPAGHYYSPVPSSEDIRSHLGRSRGTPGTLPGIRMNAAAQRELLLEFARFYPTIDFPQEPSAQARYYLENPYFSHADGIFLQCMLRKYRPKRIIEVGSGFSSAAMLDTIDRHFTERPALTFIEPFPERLKGLLTAADASRVELLEMKIQDVDLERFGRLQAGDLLFIDSSHVLKSGSDLQFLMFEVLPRLQPGVLVHFHDVFYPFEYPDAWLMEGRYWNECYFLRAFLAWNEHWEIRLFGSYVDHAFRDLITQHLPLCTRAGSASLYLQRVSV